MKIDTTKPIQLADGTPVTFEGFHPDPSLLRVRVRNTIRLFYRNDGKHRFDELPELVNVESAKVDWTKPIRTVEGCAAKLVATAENGDRIVEVNDMWVSGGSKLIRVDANGLVPGARRVSSFGTAVVRPDDVVNVPVVETVEFLNVYADGSVGSTVHKTETSARAGTKYGKTRVAILKRTLRDGKLVNAEAIPTEPQLRDRYTSAHNPFAGQ